MLGPCSGLQAEMAPSGAPGSTEFEKEECDGMEDLLRHASALRFGKDLRLLEVRPELYFTGVKPIRYLKLLPGH